VFSKIPFCISLLKSDIMLSVIFPALTLSSDVKSLNLVPIGRKASITSLAKSSKFLPFNKSLWFF